MISKYHKGKGFGLLELLISMGLGIFLLSGAVGFLISSKSTYELNDEMSWIQENARYALYKFNEDIRSAGNLGCAGFLADIAGRPLNYKSIVNNDGTWAFNVMTHWGLEGFDGNDAGFPLGSFPAPYKTSGISSLPSSDVISVTHTDHDSPVLNILPGVGIPPVGGGHSDSTSTITVAANDAFDKGDIMVVSDRRCQYSTIAQISAVAGGGLNVLQYSNAGGIVPGNCFDSLYPGKSNCTEPGLSTVSYSGGIVERYNAYAYYVQESSSGIPTLMRKRLGSDGNGAVFFDEEIVQGVENVQVFYGYESDPVLNSDGIANSYRDASEISGAEWRNVVNVRVHLLLRSINEVSTEPQKFRFVGQDYTPSKDRYLRKEFILTVRLRNRTDRLGI